MNFPSWSTNSELMGQVIAYIFGCVSGAIGGGLWRRMRQVEDRVTLLEEHEQEGNNPDDI